jgi:hypothetical protein
MAYSPRPAEQDLYRRLGVDGAFPNRPGADRFAVVTQNAGNNKIDVFLHRSVRYVVELDPSTATLRASATIRLRNDAPSSGLPPVVIASRPELRVPPGSNPVWFTFYSPHRLRSAAIDGRPLTVVSQHELGLSAVDARFSVPPGQEVTVELRFDGVLEDPSGYRLDWYQQPTVNPDDVEVRVVPPPGWPVEAGPDVDLAGGVASVRDPQSRLDGSIDLMWR